MATVAQRFKAIFSPSARRTEPPAINTSTRSENRQEPLSPTADLISPVRSSSTASVIAGGDGRMSSDSGVAGVHFEEAAAATPSSPLSHPGLRRSQSEDKDRSVSRGTAKRTFTLPFPTRTGRTRSGSTPYRSPPSPGTSALEHIRLPSFPGYCF